MMRMTTEMIIAMMRHNCRIGMDVMMMVWMVVMMIVLFLMDNVMRVPVMVMVLWDGDDMVMMMVIVNHLDMLVNNGLLSNRAAPIG